MSFASSLKPRQDKNVTICFTNVLPVIVALSGAKGLAVRFFASLRMTLVFKVIL
jgi:hypothetical protein